MKYIVVEKDFSYTNSGKVEYNRYIKGTRKLRVIWDYDIAKAKRFKSKEAIYKAIEKYHDSPYWQIVEVQN